MENQKDKVVITSDNLSVSMRLIVVPFKINFHGRLKPSFNFPYYGQSQNKSDLNSIIKQIISTCHFIGNFEAHNFIYYFLYKSRSRDTL